MSRVRQTLSPLIDKLKGAYEQKNWEALQELDLELRSQIQELVNGSLSPTDKKQLANTLKSLTRIYDVLLDSANKHKIEIGEELKKLNKDHKAVNSYIDSSKL